MTTDILSLNIIDFFTRVNGFEPTDSQRELLIGLIDPKVSKIAICSGRQVGKSLCCAVASIWLSLHQKINIIVCSAQDSWLYAHIRDIFNNVPDLKKFIVSEGVFSVIPLKGFETVNGSKVHLRASTDKSLRGVPAHVVFLDECELIADSIIQTALGNLSGAFKFVVLGTPSREHKGLFFEIIKDPVASGFRLFHWSAENCSWHSKELLDTQKQQLGEWYKSEVQGLLLEDSERGIVASKHIDACTKLNVFSEGGRIEAGVDFASGDRCLMVLTIIERLKSRVKILLTKAWNSETIDQAFIECAEILKERRPAYVKVDACPPEYQEDLRRYYTKKIYPIDFGKLSEAGSNKGRMLGQLIHKIQCRQLEIPEAETELIHQLKIYKRGSRYNDDYVDSLCLAVFEDPDLLRPELHGCLYGQWTKQNSIYRHIGDSTIQGFSNAIGYHRKEQHVPTTKTRMEQIVDAYNKKKGMKQ